MKTKIVTKSHLKTLKGLKKQNSKSISNKKIRIKVPPEGYLEPRRTPLTILQKGSIAGVRLGCPIDLCAQ